jgi:hypothetical protein
MPLARSAAAFRGSGPARASVVPARSWRLDPRRFGRAHAVGTDAPIAERRAFRFASDLKLFAVTFLAGFLFVSILLA